MKSFVITIKDLEKSVQIANRCIDSGKKFGVEVDFFPAITPRDKIYEIIEKENINVEDFGNVYSRKENAISCFLSHYMLWKKAIETNENILILEHDSVFVRKLENYNFSHLLSIGKPSYGKYKTPAFGVNELTSKDYLPGAHAYILKPIAAMELINMSRKKASPADVFINKINFPWIQEFYPWPIEAKDTFTTVQKEKGCIAKHNYKRGFEII